MSLSTESAEVTMEPTLDQGVEDEEEDETTSEDEGEDETTSEDEGEDETTSISILTPVASTAQDQWHLPWQFSKNHKRYKTRKLIKLKGRKSTRNNVNEQITAKKGKNQEHQTLSCEESENESNPTTLDLETNQSSTFFSCQDNCQDKLRHEEIESNSSKNFIDKYQPKLFEDIIGQEIIVKALSSSVQKEKVSPFYLFHGASGTGKTSMARIFAMALNCESTSHTKPCWSCSFCSRSHYLIDLCSGSRISGFRKIKTLLQSTTFMQTSTRFKVFIVEECQSIPAKAWEEFLDLTEAGFSINVVFVMIAENVNTLPKVLLSRCQKFCFPKLKDMDITLKLARIVAREKIGIEQDGLNLVVYKADGSMREAENILEQLVLLGSKITTFMVQQIVGLAPNDNLLDLLTSVISSDIITTVRSTRELILSGVQPQTLVSQLASLITVILSGAMEATTSSSASSSEDNRLVRNGSKLTQNQTQSLCRALKILVETEKELCSSNDQTTSVVEALLQIAKSADAFSPRNVLVPSDDKYDIENKEHSNINRNGREISIDSISTTRRSTKTSSSRELDLSQFGNMEEMWENMLGEVENRRVKELLSREVKLASLTISRANAIIHLMFERHKDKMEAQMLEETISEALTNAFGRPVTVNMSLDTTQSRIFKETNESTTRTQVDYHRSRPFLLPSQPPESPNARRIIMGRSRYQKSFYLSENNLRHMKLQEITELPQSPENSSPRGQEASTLRQEKVRPFSQLKENGYSFGDPQVHKPRQNELSLTSVHNGDTSIDPYTQDLMFEEATMDRENSKTLREQQCQQNETSK